MVWWQGRSGPWPVTATALFQTWGLVHSPAPENTAPRDKTYIPMCHLEARFQQAHAASEIFILLADLLSEPVYLPWSDEPKRWLHIMMKDYLSLPSPTTAKRRYLKKSSRGATMPSHGTLPASRNQWHRAPSIQGIRSFTYQNQATAKASK